MGHAGEYLIGEVAEHEPLSLLPLIQRACDFLHLSLLLPLFLYIYPGSSKTFMVNSGQPIAIGCFRVAVQTNTLRQARVLQQYSLKNKPI